MREILFKAQITDNREWVEGCYVEKIDPLLGIAKSYILNQDGLSSRCQWHEVDPKTVCQYIGRKDKNGKRIFEGDILLVGKEKWEVMYDRDNCMYVLLNDEIVCDFPSICLFDFEVIGNIHDEEE